MSKYHPAEAMTFLSQVGSDGVLSIADEDCIIFTEAPVEDDGAQINMEPDKVVLKILHQADEYRDFIKTIQSADRRIQINGDVQSFQESPPSERLVLRLAEQQPTVHEALDKALLSSHEVMAAYPAVPGPGNLLVAFCPQNKYFCSRSVIGPLVLVL